MAFSRRKFLIGVGGAVVGLPFLEGLVPKEARADTGPPPFALFYRRANGEHRCEKERAHIHEQRLHESTNAPLAGRSR